MIENARSFSIKSGYQAFQELNQRCGGRFTAVFAIADTLAIGCLRAAKESGYQLPEDLSVMGFDGISLSRQVTPKLTTIRQPIKKMIEQTLDTFQNQKREENIEITLPYKLEEGETCILNQKILKE